MIFIELAPSENIIQPPQRVFPSESTMLSRLIFDSAFRRTFYARLKTSNPFVVALYRIGLLPILGVGRNLMLLKTRGRKSGKSRFTPIGYVLIGKDIYVFSAWGKEANWYKNLAANPDEVSLQIGFRRFAARGQAVEAEVELQHTLERFVTEAPLKAKEMLGWDPAHDRIECADFSLVRRNVLIVRFKKDVK